MRSPEDVSDLAEKKKRRGNGWQLVARWHGLPIDFSKSSIREPISSTAQKNYDKKMVNIKSTSEKDTWHAIKKTKAQEARFEGTQTSVNDLIRHFLKPGLLNCK